ncbi:hypothetical protein GCM10011383_16940 [Hymenobacter cavernae]|uniref:Uncharacterized protein n=1 Tax=Hymenobacter cavernae TaxID=2044852 RepID=A0ABQ1U105_9BACT|nr:hypothetical protein GCM10011383_16940 [Hymenobacter cavernae]
MLVAVNVQNIPIKLVLWPKIVGMRHGAFGIEHCYLLAMFLLYNNVNLGLNASWRVPTMQTD